MKRFLIISSEYGSGHRMPAEAIRAALEEKGADVRVLFFSDIIGAPAERVSKRIHAFATAHFPFIHRGIAAVTDSETVLTTISNLIPQNITDGIERTIAAYRPDCVVATYPAANRIIARYKDEYGFKLVSVVTDLLSVHTYWMEVETDAYVVSLPETVKTLRTLGAPRSRIHTLGYPLREGFSERKEKEEMRGKLALPHEAFVIIYMLHSAPDPFALKLAEKICAKKNMILVALCGNDKKLARKFAKRVPRARTLGFIPNVDEYLASADAAIGKAGTGFLMECAASGCPAIITKYLKPQEEGNVHIFEKKKFGFVETSEAKAFRRVMKLRRESTAVRNNRSARMRAFAPTDATRAIAAFLLHW